MQDTVRLSNTILSGHMVQSSNAFITEFGKEKMESLAGAYSTVAS